MIAIEITGATPEEMGYDVFLKLILPALKRATEEYDEADLLLFYSGLYASLCGSLLSDFGKEIGIAAMERVNEIVRGSADAIQGEVQ